MIGESDCAVNFSCTVAIAPMIATRHTTTAGRPARKPRHSSRLAAPSETPMTAVREKCRPAGHSAGGSDV